MTTGVLLRKARDGDVPYLGALRADVETQHLLLAHPRAPVDDDAVRAWIARREAGGFFRVVADANDAPLGFLQLADIHEVDRHGVLGICLGRDARGAGVGEAAVRAGMRAALEELGLRKIVINVRSDNERALRLYRRLTFRTVGVLHAHYVEAPSRVHDVVVMERFLERSL